MHRPTAYCVACLLFTFASRAIAADWVDPSPPKVEAIARNPAPVSAAQKELTFHAAPKPLPAEARTVDSPWFLGLHHAPESDETKLLTDLTKLKPVWEIRKGNGYAAPSIAGDRLILFHRIGDEEVIECLHRETGQRYWRTAYPVQYQDRYGYTNGPRCTPAIDAQTNRIITLGVDGRLTALDLISGQVVWKRDLLVEFKLDANFFGVGATPLIESGIVIVNVGAKGACVVGFDLQTGKGIWAAPAPRDWGPSYASPIPATVHELRRVFVFAGGESRPAAGGLLCLDPKTGAVDFSFPWRGKRYESVNASSPLIVDNKVFISECYGRGGTALELSRDGDKLSAKPLWTNETFGTHFMTAMHDRGVLFGPDGHGPANCPIVAVDLKTGEEKWRESPDLSEDITTRTGERARRLRSTDRCHLLRVDGKALCLTEWGHLLWLDLSAAGCKVASRKWLFDAGETWSPPVVSRGLLYVNQNESDKITSTPQRLICYDLRGE